MALPSGWRSANSRAKRDPGQSARQRPMTEYRLSGLPSARQLIVELAWFVCCICRKSAANFRGLVASSSPESRHSAGFANRLSRPELLSAAKTTLLNAANHASPPPTIRIVSRLHRQCGDFSVGVISYVRLLPKDWPVYRLCCGERREIGYCAAGAARQSSATNQARKPSKAPHARR